MVVSLLVFSTIGEFNYTCICVVKLNCKKAISTYHDKHVFVTVESLTIINTRHWTRVKNLLLYLEVVYLSILINSSP